MTTEGQILEGFICPICMTDLNSPTQLTKHFEDVHNDDPEIFKSLKDLFGKAKKKILKQDDQVQSLSPVSPGQKNVPDSSWPEQEIGMTRTHSTYFKDIRNTRLERYASETNKLLIRLDKLLNNLPTDPTDKKVHERAIVPWIDDKDVKLCPSCAKSFHVARRKHHCRLCGTVMCQSCTIFLTLAEARKMTGPASAQDDSALSPKSPEAPITSRFIQAGIGLKKLARSPSSGSLNSVLSMISDPSMDQNFRLCQHCIDLLDSRERLRARHFDKPISHQVYERLHAHIDEANRFIDMYYKMWNSLNEGEAMYDLRDAQVLRGKIAKIGDQIDLISKKITGLSPIDDQETAQKPESRLYSMVRKSAMIFLKDHLSNIPAVPSEEEYASLRELRQRRIEARIAYDRQMEMDEKRELQKQIQRRDDWSPRTEATPSQIILNQSQGWGPSSPNMMIPSTSMDPLIQQMSNLRAYIKQAKDDCRFDEAATLEENLKEVQSAYFAMQQNECNEN